MGREQPQALGGGEWYLERPFKLVYLGLVLGVLALAATALNGAFGTFLRVLFLVAGLLTAGGGVWWRLSQSRPDDFEERSKSGILVALASGTVLTAYVALDPAWDSLKTFMLVLWVVALVAVPLILLASVGRLIVISLLAQHHLGGIRTQQAEVQS